MVFISTHFSTVPFFRVVYICRFYILAVRDNTPVSLAIQEALLGPFRDIAGSSMARHMVAV